jgi:Holliday junction resolvasome RuvABC endonuclease subunit
MIYAGFDCSSKAVHAAFVDDDENLVDLRKFGSPLKSADDRFYEILDKFNDDLSIITMTAAAIESAIYIQNAKATIAIASVVAGIKYGLHRSGISFVAVDNNTWKRQVLGKGNAKKPDIMAFAKDVWGDRFPEQDYADAACIALWRKRYGKEL